MGESLAITIVVDASQVSAGMNGVTSAVDAATARIKSAFGSVASAPEGIRNALLVLQNQAKMSATAVTEATAAINAVGQVSSKAAPQIEALEGATTRAAAGANNARSAFMGLNRELGLGGNRALSTFISQSETLGPILSKAFTGIAIAGFVQLAVLAGEKLSQLIDDTFIFTAAQKALYAEEVGANQAILAANEAHAKMLREIALIGLPILQQEKLRAQYAKEDADGLAGSIAQQEKALDVARQQLAIIQQKKDADTGPQVTGDLAAPIQSEDFDAQIKKQEAAIDSLNAKLGVLRAQYAVAGDAVDEANKKFRVEGTKETEKALERAGRATDLYIAKLQHLQSEQERADAMARTLAKDQAEFGAKESGKDSGADLKDLEERQSTEREFQQARLADKKSAALAEIEVEQDKVKELARLGKITTEQEVRQLNDLEAQKFQIEQAYLQQRINAILARLNSDDAQAYAEDAKEWSKLLTEKQKAEDTYLKNRQKNIDGAATTEEKTWQKLTTKISSAFDQSINGLIKGTETFGKAFASLFDSLLADFISFLAKQALRWAENHLLMLAEHSTFLANILGLDTANNAAKQAAQSVAAIAQVTSQAGIAGAAGFASVMASVPFPANVSLAPEVAAASIAATLANISLASAAGGWDVPSDSLAMVHQDEMILPANISSGLKDMIGNGGGNGGGSGSGGDVHVNFSVSAVDAKGVGDFFTRNQDALEKSIRRAVRRSNAI